MEDLSKIEEDLEEEKNPLAGSHIFRTGYRIPIKIVIRRNKDGMVVEKS